MPHKISFAGGRIVGKRPERCGGLAESDFECDVDYSSPFVWSEVVRS